MSNQLDEKTQRRVMAEIDLMSKEQEIKAVAEIALSRMYEIANPNHISVTDSMRFLTSLFDLTNAQALQIVGDALHRAEVA